MKKKNELILQFIFQINDKSYIQEKKNHYIYSIYQCYENYHWRITFSVLQVAPYNTKEIQQLNLHSTSCSNILAGQLTTIIQTRI